MRSQGQASCLLTLEFKCHLRYCSSQEVDVSLSRSAVLHYISEFLTLGLNQHVWPPAQDHARNSKTLGSQKSVVLSAFHDAAICASSRAHWPSCTWQLPAIAKQWQTPFWCPVHWFSTIFCPPFTVTTIEFVHNTLLPFSWPARSWLRWIHTKR